MIRMYPDGVVEGSPEEVAAFKHIDAALTKRSARPAQKALPAAKPKKAKSTRDQGNRGLHNAIREWASRNGHAVAPSGRIAQDVVDAYESDTKGALVKVRVDGKPNTGLTIGDLRSFFRMTQQYDEHEWVDVAIPAAKGISEMAAPLAIQIEGDVDCPQCGEPLIGDAVRFSLSRRDNVTHICNSCGTAEALDDFAGRMR